MEFNAFDRIPALMEEFKDHQVRIVPDAEHEEGIHLVFTNPYTGHTDAMEIIVASSTEFIVFFSGGHRHYMVEYWETEEEGYAEMRKMVHDILNNDLCDVSLFWGAKVEGDHWLGSRYISKEDVALPIETVFDSIFKSKEFRTKLKNHGGIVRYTFWNPAFSKVVEVDMKAKK